MKKTSTNPVSRFLIIAIGSMLMLPACQEENQKISPARIQFSVSLQNVSEGEAAIILLTLDKPAPQNGSVELTLDGNAIYNQHYITAPTLSNSSVVLNIYKGHKSTALKITPVDNAKYEGTMFIIFQLKNPSDGLRLGTATTLTLTIGDDEGPSLANFALNSATVNEKDENGIIVKIPFSAPAKGEGSLTVTVQEGNAVRGTNFTIDQELTNNTFSFNVVKNSAGVSFRVFPVDNDQFTGNFILQFSITDISGIVQKGNAPSYSLTLQDDEAPSIARFAVPSGTINESDGDGIIVEIPLSSPVKGEGALGIMLASQNAIYGTDFTTVPAADNDHINLNLAHNQTSATFTIFPINDDLPGGDQLIAFSIQEASGVVWKGSDSLRYELAIVDDD